MGSTSTKRISLYDLEKTPVTTINETFDEKKIKIKNNNNHLKSININNLKLSLEYYYINIKRYLIKNKNTLFETFEKETIVKISLIIFTIFIYLLFILKNSNSNLPNIIHSTNNNKLIPISDIQQEVIHPIDDKKNNKIEKACFITLCRNEDLYELLNTIKNFENNFNNRYHYDWIFFNDEYFTHEFTELVSNMVSGKAKFVKITSNDWNIPKWIDKDKMRKNFINLLKLDTPYSDSITYRHMCRFQAGLIYQNPILNNYDYFWRVDHDIKIHCNIQYDIFKFMRINKKKYGFILSLYEYPETITSLWSSTREFINKFPNYLNDNNLLNFISNDNGETYNLCHYWSNFEIGSLDFFRSEIFNNFFKFLDEKGGFYYERWGDAPIHSIATSLFLDKDEIHFFDGIGYTHEPFTSCPTEKAIRLQNKCVCSPQQDDTFTSDYVCNKKFFIAKDMIPPTIEY